MPWREKESERASKQARVVSLPAERFVTPVPLLFLRSELPARLCFALLCSVAPLLCSAGHQPHAATVALHFGIVRIPSRSFRPRTLDELRRRHDGSDERPATLCPPPTRPRTHARTHAFARLRTTLGRSDAAVQHTTTFARRDATAGSIPLTNTITATTQPGVPYRITTTMPPTTPRLRILSGALGTRRLLDGDGAHCHLCAPELQVKSNVLQQQCRFLRCYGTHGSIPMAVQANYVHSWRQCGLCLSFMAIISNTSVRRNAGMEERLRASASIRNIIQVRYQTLQSWRVPN